MREAFDVAEDDHFMTIAGPDEDNFDYGANYFGISRSDDLALIQITVSKTRTVDQKKALYRRIVERLCDSPGLWPEDIFMNLVEVAPENWSFGHGIAQHVTKVS